MMIIHMLLDVKYAMRYAYNYHGKVEKLRSDKTIVSRPFAALLERIN
jgi:hypothetical protein